MHDGFDYWVADVEDPDGTAAASLESANAAANPSTRLTSVEAAYWTDVGTREHLRWVLPHDEEPLLDALARLHVAGRDVGRRGLPPGRDVPGARPARAGLGPALGHRRGGAGGAGEPARRPTWTPPWRTPRR